MAPLTTLGHDSAGRLSSETSNGTFTESWTFNSAGLEATHTDKQGTENDTGYDAFGRGLVASATDGAGTSAPRVDADTFDNDGPAKPTRPAINNCTNLPPPLHRPTAPTTH